MYTTNNSQGSELFATLHGLCVKDICRSKKISSFWQTTYLLNHRTVFTKREKKLWAFSVLCSYKYRLFYFPSPPRVKIFQNLWVTSTAIVGEKGRMRVKTVFLSKCVPAVIHAYNPLQLPLHILNTYKKWPLWIKIFAVLSGKLVRWILENKYLGKWCFTTTKYYHCCQQKALSPGMRNLVVW